MNLELIKARSQIVKLMRQWFDERGFWEMHTPRLVGLPGQEPYLEPMWTRVHIDPSSPPLAKGTMPVGNWHRGEVSAALITSPEYAMKKILAAGLDKIYDLGPCFRDGEPWDGSHDPEFLLLEWYRREAGLEELFRDTEEMIKWVASSFVFSNEVEGIGVRDREWIDKPFRRLTVAQAMKQYADVDLDPLLDDRDAMARAVQEHGQSVQPTDTWDDLFFKIFLSEVEPKLGWSNNFFQPTFLYNYPACMAALARRNPEDPRYALRTELYIGSLELANGFAELADEQEQRTRFEEERALRRSLEKKTWPLDEVFLKSLPHMGNAAGIAFGVERLVMLLTHTSSISDLLPIPVQERFPVDGSSAFRHPEPTF